MIVKPLQCNSYKEELRLRLAGTRHEVKISEKYGGGVCGCPNGYFEGATDSRALCNASITAGCVPCWNNPYKGEKFIYQG